MEKEGFSHGKNFKSYSRVGLAGIDGNWPFLVSVGDNVTLTPNVRILAHDASTSRTGAGSRVGIVSIGSNVFIGAESIVLCNVRIGDNVIVGAGSVVTRDIPSNSVVVGNPAKVICSFDEFKNKHLSNRTSDEHPIFSQYGSKEWKNINAEEKKAMRLALKNTYGYLS